MKPGVILLTGEAEPCLLAEATLNSTPGVRCDVWRIEDAGPGLVEDVRERLGEVWEFSVTLHSRNRYRLAIHRANTVGFSFGESWEGVIFSGLERLRMRLANT